MRKIVGVTSDCLCDMSENILKQYDVQLTYFYVMTDTGCFEEQREITSENVVEYLENGGVHIRTVAPTVDEYEAFFRKKLVQCEEIIHIAGSSRLSPAYDNAMEAATRLEGKVQVFDTGQLSGGMGHFIIRAARLAQKGKHVEEIVRVLAGMKRKVYTSFIAENADYLYRSGRVNKLLMQICSNFNIHPILSFRNGVVVLEGVEFGNYEKAVKRYVEWVLRRSDKINKKRVFITHSSSTFRMVSIVKAEVSRRMKFDEVLVTQSSATISCNCGPNVFGILYVRK